MFKIKMTDARLWKNLTAAIATLVDEASFNVDKDTIKLRAMDPAHVAMVDFELPKTVFDEYICDETTKLCINASEMLKLLRRVGSDESIELNIDPARARLNIILRSKYTRTFSMATLEPSIDETPTPKLSFNAKVKTTTTFMKDAIEDTMRISDYVKLEANEGKFTLESKGNLGSASIEAEKESEEILNLDVKEPSKATFSLNFLSEMIKAASKVSDIITVEFSTNMPVRLDLELLQQGKFQYYLAPYKE
jgi:proliferating cell nuclear antigen